MRRYPYLFTVGMTSALALGACNASLPDAHFQLVSSSPSPAVAATATLPQGPIPATAEIAGPSPPAEGGISEGQDRLIPPAPPFDVQTVRRAGLVEVRWQGTGSDIITHYLIYRRASDLDAWDSIDQVPAQGDNQELYVYQVRAAEEGTPLQYAVAAVDRYGNRSTPSSAP